MKNRNKVSKSAENQREQAEGMGAKSRDTQRHPASVKRSSGNDEDVDAPSVESQTRRRSGNRVPGSNH
ncbi:MAG TPA: hypothetical protein VF145_03525 [Chitinophagaceae bacterium]